MIQHGTRDHVAGKRAIEHRPHPLEVAEVMADQSRPVNFRHRSENGMSGVGHEVPRRYRADLPESDHPFRINFYEDWFPQQRPRRSGVPGTRGNLACQSAGQIRNEYFNTFNLHTKALHTTAALELQRTGFETVMESGATVF